MMGAYIRLLFELVDFQASKPLQADVNEPRVLACTTSCVHMIPSKAIERKLTKKLWNHSRAERVILAQGPC